jgi:hypothetical protein
LNSSEPKVTGPTIKLSTKQEVVLCWATTEFRNLGVQSIPNDQNPEDPRVFVVFNKDLVLGFFPCGSINVVIVGDDNFKRTTFEKNDYEVKDVISFVEDYINKESEEGE